MTCGNCEASVRSSLLKLAGVTAAEVSKVAGTAVITMQNHISLDTLQAALGGENGKYKISATHHNETAEQAKSWLATYKPLLVVFGFITILTLIAATRQGGFNGITAMNTFMAGFFIAFSFFKMLDLRGFAESYTMYDIVARRWQGWGYVYAFAELGLGLMYLTGTMPILTNGITFVLMSVSIVGVLQSVLNKRAIQCACLGAVFNLPMSTVTIIEDALMIAMSGTMLAMLL